MHLVRDRTSSSDACNTAMRVPRHTPTPEASRQAAHPLWCRFDAHHCCLKLQHLQLLLTLLRDQLRKPGSVVVSRVSACVFVPLAHMMPTPDSLPQHCRPALVGSGRRARASFLLLSRCSNSSSSQLQAGYSLSADSPGTFCYILCSVYLAYLDATCQLAGWTGCCVNEHERDDIRVPRELHTLLKRQQLWLMPRSRVRALVFSFLLDILL